jgi:hypothetical protein
MTRVKLFASLCFMALFGALAGASAAPLPPASPAGAQSLAQPVDYRRCFWSDGRRICRTYDDDDVDVDDDYDGGPDYSYYGAPGIYLGFGGIGGFGHGSHGHVHGGGHGHH